MPIGVVVFEGSQRAIVAQFNDVRNSLLRAVASVDSDQAPLLKWVWGYDDTSFNSRQAEAIVAELEVLSVGQPSQVQDDLASIAELAVATAAQPHRHLVFLGD